MGHNSIISNHPKSTGIPQVDGLSTGPPDLGRHTSVASCRGLQERKRMVESQGSIFGVRFGLSEAISTIKMKVDIFKKQVYLLLKVHNLNSFFP